jgi:hypothetical protein
VKDPEPRLDKLVMLNGRPEELLAVLLMLWLLLE